MSKDDDRLTPKDHAEAVAIFRMQVLGRLLSRDLMRGELAPALRALSEERFMPPGSLHSKTFAVPTLQTWYYRARRHGLEGLKPRPRSDRGYAQVLTDRQRDLLLEIRRGNRPPNRVADPARSPWPDPAPWFEKLEKYGRSASGGCVRAI